MTRAARWLQKGVAVPLALIAGVVAAAVALSGALLDEAYDAGIHLEPATINVAPGETFELDIVVDSRVPVNVFSGDVQFDPQVISVESIDYNTSIADLWVQKPWYENGDGTLNFGGGTTKPGGFSGSGVLLHITFRTNAVGTATVVLTNAQIFLHDGLGTEASTKPPIDAIVTVASQSDTTNMGGVSSDAVVSVYSEHASTDLDGDGKQTISDVSIFMIHMFSGDTRYDFNGDGSVNISDFGILVSLLR